MQPKSHFFWSSSILIFFASGPSSSSTSMTATSLFESSKSSVEKTVVFSRLNSEMTLSPERSEKGKNFARKRRIRPQKTVFWERDKRRSKSEKNNFELIFLGFFFSIIVFLLKFHVKVGNIFNILSRELTGFYLYEVSGRKSATMYLNWVFKLNNRIAAKKPASTLRHFFKKQKHLQPQFDGWGFYSGICKLNFLENFKIYIRRKFWSAGLQSEEEKINNIRTDPLTSALRLYNL